jgi:hypothetical protein
MPLVRRRWHGDEFRLRRPGDRPRGDRYVCASFSFGRTLFCIGSVSFSLVYLLGAAFSGAAVSYTAVSFGDAAFCFRYAPRLIGFGERHFASSENVRAANQASSPSTSK